MTRRIFILAVGLTLLTVPSRVRAQRPAEPADLVLLNAKVWTAEKDQPWAEAVAIRGNRIVKVGMRARVEDGPNQVFALGNAGLLLAPAKPAEAEQLFAQALALARKEAKRPLATAQALHSVGESLYGRKLPLQYAREFLTAALAIWEKLAPNSLEAAKTLHWLGWVEFQWENLGTARHYYLRALAIREELAPESVDLALTLRNRAERRRRELPQRRPPYIRGANR